jgi:tetratricopeptide (TPR) repeat protein
VLAALVATSPTAAQEPPAEPARQPAATAAEQPALQPVPEPSLDGLEPAVADQLVAQRDLALVGYDPATATPAQKAAAFGELGKIYHAYGFAAAAEAAYSNAALLAPSDPRWPYYLGALYAQAGRFDEAIDAYRRALQQMPGNATIRIRMAEVERARGRPAAAEVLLEEALLHSPGNPAATAALGEIALARGDYREAVARLEEVMEAVPEANQLHYPLAQAYRGLGDAAAARAHLAKRGQVGIQPDDPMLAALEQLKQGERIHLLRGQTAFRAGRWADAVREFGEAVAAEPESARAQINLATALAAAGDPAAAVDHLRIAVDLAPDNPTARLNLGRLLFAGGDLNGAIVHLSQAVELAEGDAEVQVALADALRAADRSADAIPHYSMAATLEPTHEGAWVGGADALVRLGRYQEARKLLEGALAKQPSSGQLAHALARLLAGCPDPALRDGERALELAAKVWEAQPTPRHGDTLSMALAEVGRCADAAALASQLLAATGAGDPGRAARELALARYSAGPPCREPTAP